MSGFVGIVNLDGAPVDPVVLERMTRFLSFRGPDSEGFWCSEAVGLGHTLLRTSREVPLVEQPVSLDGRLWIVADARIDARAELIDNLKVKSPAAGCLSLSTPDAELLLNAYDVWGNTCVEHLLGDFSFAIWDGVKRRLFCARDQLGVKPFLYARVGSSIVFSNTLTCVRQHPAVSSELNDLAIADFLLFDIHQHPEATAFADIQRLPPAHVMTCEQGTISVRRYWTLSVTTSIHYRRNEEYIERFRELFDGAVADRLGTESAGVLMSGGLDSTTVAASAQQIMTRRGNTSGLHASTEVFDQLIPHEERRYATLAANALKIPIQYYVSDHWKIFEIAGQPEDHTPEPMHSALPNTTVNLLRQVAAKSRVALTGYGGDPLLCGRISVHFLQLIKKKQFGQGLADAARFLAVEGRFSRLYLRTRWRILIDSKKERPSFPPWLNETFESKLNLGDRWRELCNKSLPSSSPAVRPEAQEVTSDPMWANLFESHDAGVTKVTADVCHPFFDLRLANFLLALPRLPWCSDKELLREAARGVLPDQVRLRRKSPLPADQLVALIDRPESAWVDTFKPLPELEQYIVRSRVPVVSREKDPWRAWINLRPLSLNFWLHGHLGWGKK
jgi:asparagine synthase (glutamine-hydrolysing)